MRKTILATIIMIILSSCSTTIPKNQFAINIKSLAKSNNGNNYLVVYEQPSSMDQITQTTYDSLSKQILGDNYQTKLVHPENKIDTLSFKSQDEPGAIYFIVNNKSSYNTWKFYIPNPSGSLWNCFVDENGYINCKNNEE